MSTAAVGIFGFTLGIFSAFLFLTERTFMPAATPQINPPLDYFREQPRGRMLKSLKQEPRSENLVRKGCNEDEDAEAKRLERKVRVLCWIMTGPQNLDSKAIHVKNTWGRRCNKLLFMSSVHNESFPTVGLNVSEGRDHLTAKTMQAFNYVYDNHFEDADWFIKADDDTYVIMENLRHFLSDKNTNHTVFYGHHFFPSFIKPRSKQGYFAGGAGYVLSKATLKKLRTFGHNPSLCRQDGGMEDIEMGLCLEKLNVTRGNTTDAHGRRRFHPFQPEVFLHGRYNDGFKDYDGESQAIKGMGSISDYAVSFHYVPPAMMYDLEFYVYHLRPYGITSHPQDINIPI